MPLLAGAARFVGSASSDGLTGWLDRSRWPSRPLRIGVLDGASWSRPLTSTLGAWELEWVDLSGGRNPASLCGEHVLDAIVRRGGLNALTAEFCQRADREAAWEDWTRCSPLSYPAVFPARFDAARLELPDGLNDDPAVVRAVIELGALLSRHPARLAALDRFNGRRPYCGAPESSPGKSDACLHAMQALAAAITNATPTAGGKSAARVLGAFLATSPCWSDDTSRLYAMDRCATLTGDEPHTMLRLAAVRLGVVQDSAGIDAVERADRMLRERSLVSATSQEAFICSELEHGHPGPMTIGRLAAGICMLVSTMPASRVPYFRDDLLDDMRFSSLLIGRDQDRKLLMEVFRVLERVRRAESFGLPISTGVRSEEVTDTSLAEQTPASAPKARKSRAASKPRRKAA